MTHLHWWLQIYFVGAIPMSRSILAVGVVNKKHMYRQQTVNCALYKGIVPKRVNIPIAQILPKRKNVFAAFTVGGENADVFNVTSLHRVTLSFASGTEGVAVVAEFFAKNSQEEVLDSA
mmetsp:Transcript_16482/g.22780  ORF Transcript_16482/g.22780 Transcript_16482/m.22780 type:complete len:119 (+) Transcript_16482:732-1088(+)